MSYRIGHPPLSASGYAWLAAIADPMARVEGPAQPIAASEVPVLIDAAAAHGILPAAARNLARVAGTGAGQPVDPATATALAELDGRRVLVAGQCLLLMHHANRISAALAEQAVPAAIVKGPVFARRLYPQAADRSFTDIDILVAPAALAATSDILRRLGFVEATDPHADPEAAKAPVSEYKWLLPGNDVLLVEVQTDLIHASDGVGIHLTYADLVEAGNGDPEEATALLLVAAVHGVAGHQFERLQPAVDVLQAVRGAAGPIDPTRLARVGRATGATKALQTALDAVARLFAEPEAARMADAMTPASWRRLRRTLLSPSIVLRSQASGAGRDSWRRRAVRELVR